MVLALSLTTLCAKTDWLSTLIYPENPWPWLHTSRIVEWKYGTMHFSFSSEDRRVLTKLWNLWDVPGLTWLCEEFFFGEFSSLTAWVFFLINFVMCVICVIWEQFHGKIYIDSRRYFKYELFPKGAISKEDLSKFLYSWLDRWNSTCMFSANQQRIWSTSHLTGCGWYINCAPSFTPPFEIELRKSREAVGESGVEMVDLQGI